MTVRYSNSKSGNPWGPATSPSMAVRFYLPDGTTTDLVSLTIPLFLARTPEETLEFLEAVRPDPTTGELIPTGRTVSRNPSMELHAPSNSRSLPASWPCQTAFHASCLPIRERGR